jgi:alpha-methylacyl-CoA racemase
MGPLQGVKVVEMAGIGPISFAGMLLADLGAEVTRIERPAGSSFGWGTSPVLDRGRIHREVDLKSAEGLEEVLGLVVESEVLIEGFRPGVMERLGLGPEECLGRNPALVYGRMTGWGQSGRYAHTAGHDITYLAISGALHMVGEEGGKPVPPVNLLGDFGAGGIYLAFGVVSALLHARAGGVGQVVDAAIVDGAASVTGMLHGLLELGAWKDERGVNLLDGGAPFYDCYQCADGEWVAVGALEPQFYRALIEKLRMADDEAIQSHLDPSAWPAIRERLGAKFAERDRDEWHELFADSDCCVAPVLSMREARQDGHNRDRGIFVEVGGMPQPAPAPRFSVTEPDAPAPVTGAGRGIGAATVAALAADGWSVVAVDRCSSDRRLPYPMASERDLDAAVAAAAERAGQADVARAVVADAADTEALAAVVEGAEAWGDLDAFVANAGVIAGGLPAWELPAEQQRALLEVNLEAVMLAARFVVPALLGRPRPRAGRFVAVTSSGATRGMSGLAAYSAAKAGVEGFIRGLAADLHGSGVTANAVAPGSTDTPLLAESARLFELPSPRDFAPRQPLERLLEPEEVAAMIAYLLGPGGSGVTGATLPVDGGLTI